MEAPRARRPLRLLGRSHDRAFEQLYRRHVRDVYQYALAVLASPADAEDVTQTTFLNAYRAFQKGERPQKPHNWLIAIAHNVCRMRWRQARARPNEVALDEAPEPVSHDHERADLGEVLTALSQLSFNQRAALVMRELEGRSYQEIADILGTTVSSVEALLFRARRRLQSGRRTLGILTTVPLPGSLSAFVGGGGGVVAAGGTALGADLVLKAAAVVVAGVATAGVGYEAVGAISPPGGAPPAHADARAAAATRAHRTRATLAARRRAALAPQRRRTRRAVAATGIARLSRPGAGAEPASAPAQQQPAATPPPPAAAALLPPPPAVTVPALPPTPPASVPPAPPLPPLPPPPLTVTAPPLPPPPPLP